MEQVAVFGNRIIAVCPSSVSAFDLMTSKLLWEWKESHIKLIIADNKRLYTLSWHGMQAVDLNTGKLVWIYQPAYNFDMCLYGNFIMTMTNTGACIAIHSDTGTKAFTMEPKCLQGAIRMPGVPYPLVIRNNKLFSYITTQDAHYLVVFCLKEKKAILSWTAPLFTGSQVDRLVIREP